VGLRLQRLNPGTLAKPASNLGAVSRPLFRQGEEHGLHPLLVRTRPRAAENPTARHRRRLPAAPAPPPPLAGSLGQGKAKIGPKELVFNGPEPEDYESFVLSARLEDYDQTKQGLFAFCKTERRPYDRAVQVALTLLRWHAGEAVRVTSDGVLLDWQAAVGLVEKELGYPVDPFFVLERELVEVRDRQGRRFLVEAEKEGVYLNYLHWLAEEKKIPFNPPFQVGEAVRRGLASPLPGVEGVFYL